MERPRAFETIHVRDALAAAKRRSASHRSSDVPMIGIRRCSAFCRTEGTSFRLCVIEARPSQGQSDLAGIRAQVTSSIGVVELSTVVPAAAILVHSFGKSIRMALLMSRAENFRLC